MDERLRISNETLQQLKQAIDLREIAAQYTTLQGYNEKYGPCPRCGGEDRFHVQQQMFFCRQCYSLERGRGRHDAFEFAIFLGLAGGFGIVTVFRRNLVPEYMKVPVLFVTVIVTFAAAEAFLAALAHEQAVRAAQANVDRLETFGKAVYALVNNQLRPGVEASRADVELVAAKNQLIQLQQQAELARIALAEAIGQPGTIAKLDPGPLLEYAPPAPAPVNTFNTHPLFLTQSAAIAVVKARQTTLDKAFFPRFNWQTAVFGRGTGAQLDGTFREGRGLYPDTFNYATGFTVTFTPSDWFGLKAKRRIERFNLQAEEARLAQVTNTLKTQEARARALIETARKLADNAPAQVNAATETLTRSKVRYEYGLTTIPEVADAQRLLAQAEIDEAVARLGVWRAYLVAAKLQGELKPFLDQMSSVQAERK